MGCVPAWLMQVLCAVYVTVTLMTIQVQNLKNKTTTGDNRKKLNLRFYHLEQPPPREPHELVQVVRC